MFSRVSDQKRSEAGFFHRTAAQRRPNVLQLLRADGRIFRSSPRAHSRSHGWRLTVPDGRLSVPTVFQVTFLEGLLGPPAMSPAQQMWVHLPLRHPETSDLQHHRFSRGDPDERCGGSAPVHVLKGHKLCGVPLVAAGIPTSVPWSQPLCSQRAAGAVPAGGGTRWAETRWYRCPCSVAEVCLCFQESPRSTRGCR